MYRAFYNHSGFMLRDLRGASQNAMPKEHYFNILQHSKFCLAPCGMGFSTRVYESIAQVDRNHIETHLKHHNHITLRDNHACGGRLGQSGHPVGFEGNVPGWHTG